MNAAFVIAMAVLSLGAAFLLVVAALCVLGRGGDRG